MLVTSNAYASLSGSISAGTANPLTVTVASGQGSRFSPISTGSGHWFLAALVDEALSKVEIVHVYQHDSGADTFVCLRARDGTTARDWSDGADFMQISDTKSGWGDALDVFAVKAMFAGSGTNTITASAGVPYMQLIDGMEFVVKAAGGNTGPATLALTFDHSAFGGTTYVQSARSIVKENFAVLDIGDIPAAGYPIKVKYMSTPDKYVMLNPANLGIGRVEMLAHGNIPSGWLACDGSQVAIATYPLLAAALGTTWGTLTNGSGGAGSTHFRLPDLRGRSPLGYGQGNTASGGGVGTSRTVGQLGGTETHVLSANEMPTHNHLITSNTLDSAGDSAYVTGSGGTQSTRGDLIGNAGGGLAHNNMHPFGVLHMIIRAA